MASKIGSSNGFAVLDSLKKKKNSSKNKGSLKSQVKKPEPVFWNPKPLVNKSWADVEDEDDDDYYATSAPPKVIWGSLEPVNQQKEVEVVIEEEIESDDDLDIGDEEFEEESESEAPIPTEPVEKTSAATTSAPKDTERQLSKKELKKKGLEELDALLAELGISGKDNNLGQEHPNEGKKSVEQIVEGENLGSAQQAPAESKTSKKKKKKDRSSKEAKDPQDQQQVNGADSNRAEDEVEASAAVDVKERLKKAAGTVRKKKTSKEMDAAAKAAAFEAAARSARLAAAKKKGEESLQPATCSTMLDKTKDEMVIEEKDGDDNEMPLGKIMKVLKSQGAKKKKKLKRHDEKEPKIEDDVLGVVKEINLDNMESEWSMDIGKLTKDNDFSESRHMSIENSSEEVSMSRKQKESNGIAMLHMPTPKRKKSASTPRPPSTCTKIRNGSKVLSKSHADQKDKKNLSVVQKLLTKKDAGSGGLDSLASTIPSTLNKDSDKSKIGGAIINDLEVN